MGLRKCFFCLLLCPLAILPATTKKPVTINAVVESANSRRGVGSVVWSPDGTRFIARDRSKLLLYDVSSGKTHDILDTAKLREAANAPPANPVFDWTNRGVTEENVQWFADNKHLLVAESGDLFLVDAHKGTFQQITDTPVAEADPKLSPDNKYVSFRRGHNLYTIALADKAVHQLTHDGTDTLLNGELDWVYPEELALGTAHWWSPDSKQIAYLQFDVSREPVFPQVSLLKERGVLEPERYPKAGDPNAEVRLGVAAAEGGATRWMDLGEPRDHLLARVTWLPNSREIAVERLPRVQNRLDLLAANVETGKTRLLLHEEDPYWINVEGEPKFLGNGERFLWTSERDGFRHLYLYRSDGHLEKQLTRGEWQVESLAGVDRESGRIFYVSTEASPLERQLYSVNADGANPQRLTEGAGTHTISMGPHAGHYLDTYSSLSEPSLTTLFTSAGKEVRVYKPADTRDRDTYDILPTEIVKVKTSDGTLLYARMIKPAGFDPHKKYPAVVMVYGGPHAQTVQDRWSGLSWDQALAHKGFVIWGLDNRGSFGRGHRFESAVYHKLGSQELADQTTGIDYLVSLGFVNRARLGLYGWSYGGYMTLYTVTNAPGLIKAAIAGAPVTSWRNYDSIYTERYMGLPADNVEAYQSTSPQTAAHQLESKLLLVHNIEDDNVHFANSIQMADVLEKAGKQFYMLVYPQKSHGVNGPVRQQMLEELTQFFEENLNR